MSTAVRLLFISGSARRASFNKRLARLGATIAEANGIPATFLDLGDYPMPIYDGDLEADQGAPDQAKKLKHVLGLHNGVFIASPEYNSSISPLLKNALDWVSRVREDDEAPNEVFKTRVFAIGAASPGGLGGLRGLNTVRQVLELGLGALVLPDQIAVPRAAEAFDDDGHLKNKDQQATFKAQIHKLARAAHVLHG